VSGELFGGEEDAWEVRVPLDRPQRVNLVVTELYADGCMRVRAFLQVRDELSDRECLSAHG
jgi:hypothetical protein